MKDNEVMVSVAIRACNQESQIIKALDSVMEQNVDFGMQIVVGIDKSGNPNDGTYNAVKRYESHLAKGFTLEIINHEENAGALRNLYDVLQKCRGKYVAWLDGDDYWLDADKTMNAVNLLEKQEEIGVVYTNDYVHNVNDGTIVKRGRNVLSDKCFSELLLSNYITSETVVFRRDLLKYVDFDSLLKHDWPADDWFIWLEFSNHTRFKHIASHTSAATVARCNDENIPLAALAYTKKNLEMQKHYIRKYPNNTYLKEEDLDNAFYESQYKTSILMCDKDMAKDAISHIKYAGGKKGLLYSFIAHFPLGFNIYMFYRKMMGKDKKTPFERYWY